MAQAGTVVQAGTMAVDADHAPWRWVARSTTTWASAGDDADGTLTPLSPGSPVALCASGPGNRHRLQRAAGRADVGIDRVYLAVPSLRSPVVLVEDKSAAVRLFLAQHLTVPPSRFPGVVTAAVTAARWIPPSWLRRLAWSRIGIGWRR